MHMPDRFMVSTWEALSSIKYSKSDSVPKDLYRIYPNLLLYSSVHTLTII